MVAAAVVLMLLLGSTLVFATDDAFSTVFTLTVFLHIRALRLIV
jgi:hypothetical protein